MILKLGERNLLEKPGKAIATILVIALAVAILFCVLSYNSTVQSYMHAVETSNSGNSDITISYRSDGARIVNTNSLNHLQNDFEYCVGALSIFGIYENDESDNYVYLRGFDRDSIETISEIEFVEGSIENLTARYDNVAVSETTAKELGLSLNSEISITVMNVTKTFYVAAIAKGGGLFAKNSPYTIIGINSGVTRFFSSEWGGLYSEIYIKLKDGVLLTSAIEAIKAIPDYHNMKVEKSIDNTAIDRKSSNLAAPVNIVGAAVIFLALVAILMLFATNEKSKRTFISKMTSIGATKNQVAGIIAVETAIFAVIGSLLGIAFAVVIFKLLLQWTLGSAITLPISFWKLIVSMTVGIIVTMLAGSIPMFLARRRSVRENLLATSKENNKQKLALFIFMSILLAVCLFFEFTIETATAGVYALIAFIVLILMVVMFSPMFLTLFEKITRHTQKCNKSLRIATLNLSRVQSSRRGVQILALGLTVSVMLFVAWNMTTT
ncbi:MAG TPA: FtsX-like permease family protein, partial [Clostridia bacterium]|nr:FtsX-like permease family protein [Clostridia bacterium]